MTQPTDIRRVALALAATGVPVLPLSRGKRPVANCGNCARSACGDRPHMLAAGPCLCPRPCHGWAAATTDPDVITSAAWLPSWRTAAFLAYHPGGADLTVVDLDNDAAIAWARQELPPTRTVATTRGEHWIYRGAMRSANGVRPGVDIKSLMSYARWRGPGTGTTAPLPDTVRALLERDEPTQARMAHAFARPSLVMPSAPGGGACPHRSPAYLERGIAMAVQRIGDARAALHNTAYSVFLAVLSTHGRCGCLTDAHIQRLFAAAHARGESPRHCTDAWANARVALGM
ncbi:bifunctional DNA primase/polymerase [Streptomyces benahoarensis]|uniref:Bifunctional DNA primase/polymerase n=1 Tax=Streptomyces benahoarensis TaxID=2595054 RepID=A0A553ZPD4_9ACTN|nr:bifunctional DNA primase/polymerase [Streptomyces benahoarensis]TSB28287.1 bifunctional DNA primase/polymerase [Streptomyces benahoarensis]TSB43317.1 bifunctional DNA primase/polymerase [Streptomyces benahoarensis]